jgi:hypothetical protein
MVAEVEQKEVARFFTRSRRFRKFLGRLPDGTKLPGGPYTIVQGLVLAVVLIVACITQGIWGTGTAFVDFPLAGAFAWAAAWGAGRIPMTRRNLFSVITGGLTAMLRTSAGSFRGAPLRIRPPHQATGKSHIGHAPNRPIAPAPAEPAVETVPAPAPAPVPVSVPQALPAGVTARPALSGVTAMLLQARTETTATRGSSTTTTIDD